MEFIKTQEPNTLKETKDNSNSKSENISKHTDSLDRSDNFIDSNDFQTSSFTEKNSYSNNIKENINRGEYTNFSKVKKNRKGIHAKFIFLKRKLNLQHFMRKTQIDSLLKKCKSKAYKNIHEALKKCLKIKLPRLPQTFITNIKIEFNKNYLNKTVLEIYREFNIINSYQELLEKNSIIENRKKVFEDFLNLTFKNVYEHYINSYQFKKDYLLVCEREGQKFAILFSYISQIFIKYYQKSTGNKKKPEDGNESRENSEDLSDCFNDYNSDDSESENLGKNEKRKQISTQKNECISRLEYSNHNIKNKKKNSGENFLNEKKSFLNNKNIMKSEYSASSNECIRLKKIKICSIIINQKNQIFEITKKKKIHKVIEDR